MIVLLVAVFFWGARPPQVIAFPQPSPAACVSAAADIKARVEVSDEVRVVKVDCAIVNPLGEKS